MSRFRHVMQYKGPESAIRPPLVFTLNTCDSFGKKRESSPPNLPAFMAGWKWFAQPYTVVVPLLRFVSTTILPESVSVLFNQECLTFYDVKRTIIRKKDRSI